jgi:hypothetical protein
VRLLINCPCPFAETNTAQWLVVRGICRPGRAPISCTGSGHPLVQPSCSLIPSRSRPCEKAQRLLKAGTSCSWRRTLLMIAILIAALLVLSVSVVTVGERRRRRRRGGGDGASDGLGQGNDGANSTPGCAATFLPLPSSSPAFVSYSGIYCRRGCSCVASLCWFPRACSFCKPSIVRFLVLHLSILQDRMLILFASDTRRPKQACSSYISISMGIDSGRVNRSIKTF